MEKLLPEQHKNKNNDASNMTRYRTKNIFFSIGGYENIFCQHTGEKHFNQPYSGCFILVNL
jgi:hypothetical protein